MVVIAVSSFYMYSKRNINMEEALTFADNDNDSAEVIEPLEKDTSIVRRMVKNLRGKTHK